MNTQQPQHPCQHSAHPGSLHLSTPTASFPSYPAETRSSSPEGEQDAGTTQREGERQEQTGGDLKRQTG